MPDSTPIHFAGDWVTHNGNPANGALLYVYDAGTLNLADIWSDADLGSTRANPIEANANGFLPFAFIDTQDYKVILKTAGGVTIVEQDDLPGALNTTPFSASTFAKPDTDVTSKTSDYTLVEADLGGIFNGTCTGGTVQFTLLSAVTATNGRGFTIRHNGTANYVKIVSVSSQTIARPATGVTTTGFALVGYGESVTLVSDGANWHVAGYVPPLVTAATGVITIRDRVSSAPVSPNPGDRYIVTGAYSTFEQEDIIEYDGQGNYIEYSPPEDCGWLAYVQDENAYYSHVGTAWVQGDATSTVAGRVKVSTQAIMEAATAADTAVLVGHQHYHPSAAKAWLRFNASGTVAASYNVSSVTDTGTGNWAVNFTTAFSSANYGAAGFCRGQGDTDTSSTILGWGSPAAASCPIRAKNGLDSAVDSSTIGVCFFGDQ